MRYFIRILLLSYCLFTGFISGYAQNAEFVLGETEYGGARVFFANKHKWESITLKHKLHLKLSPADSISIKKGAVTVLKGDSIAGVGYEGTWSVEQIVKGESKPKDNRGTNSPGDSIKGIRTQDSWAIDIVTNRGKITSSPSVGDSISVAVSNISDKESFIMVWWMEFYSGELYNLSLSDESIRIPSHSVKLVPSSGPIGIEAPGGPVNVYLSVSDKPFTSPEMPVGKSIKEYEQILKQSCDYLFFKHIRVLSE